MAQASAHCKSFGGQVAAPSDEEENEKALNLITNYPQCMDDSNSVAWIGVEQKANSRKWNQVGKENNGILFNKLKINILKDIENNVEDVCVAMKSDGSWNIFHDCYSVTNSIPACNVCQFDRVPSFLV